MAVTKTIVALAAAACMAGALAAPAEETLQRLAQIRALPAATGTPDALRQRGELDAAWRWFGNHKAEALPVLRRELAAELKKAQPDQLILLDVGYFLRAQGEPGDKALALQALLRIDPDGTVPKSQSQQLFRFVHALAAERDARLFPLMDKVFLRGHVTVFLPQQGYTVDETSTCIYLYGQYGAAAERHLRGLLGDPGVVQRALEVLMWVGSPDSVPAVAALLNTTDADTFARAATFLLRAGGPQGRDALRAFDPRGLQGKALEFYRQTRGQLDRMSFEALADQLVEVGEERAAAPPPAVRGLDATSARQALDQLYGSYGSYEGIAPAALARAALPKAALIDELVKVRERSLLRVSGEALADIDTTNTLVNTVRFRE
ncbi:hypothetical protein [Pseudoduganella armeniaca]|uniref:Tetratricopeptide repeat protein n=1 Tax=Pseudoduganella armeniaca TaxID=2072590 RepID=A0A2R4CCI6_9BURK|nr:hypothetical protein [Pseudoduganella armeniaca]AVR97200.1 hypothetical protein C9I28_17295 [Pseudoduganella armeniaca]